MLTSESTGVHFEVYCIPDNLKPRAFLDLNEAVKVYEEHLEFCRHKKRALLVRVVHKTKSAPEYRDVMLP